MLPPCEPPSRLLPRCAEFRRRNRAIYGDAMIARKIDLCRTLRRAGLFFPAPCVCSSSLMIWSSPRSIGRHYVAQGTRLWVRIDSGLLEDQAGEASQGWGPARPHSNHWRAVQGASSSIRRVPRPERTPVRGPRPPALDNARLYLPLAPRDHKVARRAQSCSHPIAAMHNAILPATKWYPPG